MSRSRAVREGERGAGSAVWVRWDRFLGGEKPTCRRAPLAASDAAAGLAVPSLDRAAIPTACGLLGAIVMP